MKISTLALAGLGLAAASRFALRNAGVTHHERQRALPGDELVPGAGRPCTMATTVDAPPSQVWQWLVQMGCDRGGFYSFDRLDNGGTPSVEEIRPEWQTLKAGDRHRLPARRQVLVRRRRGRAGAHARAARLPRGAGLPAVRPCAGTAALLRRLELDVLARAARLADARAHAGPVARNGRA